MFAALIVCICFASGCLVLVGSGQTVTYSVEPPQGVSSLQIQNSFQVKVQPGTQDRFDFTIDKNLRAFVELTEEEPGEWTLRLLPGVAYKTAKLDVLVTVKTFPKLTLNQNAIVEVSEFTQLQTSVRIRVNDDAKLRWLDLARINNLNLEIKNNAQAEFFNLLLLPNAEALCRCKGGQLILNGSGTSFSLSAKNQHKSKLMGFSVQTMDVELSDFSSAEITVQKTLSVSLYGETSLLYSGDPEVQIKFKERNTSITQKKPGT